eukprot:scaffold588_cov282-Chaetoceros_neogracile.AAC.1
MSPTSSTPRPSVLTTVKPTSSKVEKCSDTPGDFKMGSKITTCKKLRFIKDACSREKAAKLCPMTCGTCSKPTNQNDSSPTRAPSISPNDDTDKNDDDEVSEKPECVDSLQTIMIGSKDFSCERVAWQKKKYCTKLGGRVAKHCPQTCNKCDKPCTRNDPRPGCPGNDEKDTMAPTTSSTSSSPKGRTSRPSVLTTVKPTLFKAEECNDTLGDFKMGSKITTCKKLRFIKESASVSAIEAAYTDAEGRSNPNQVELFAGSFPESAVLEPGIYKWTSNVTIPVGGNATFDGSSNDQWIMQISGNLAIGINANILLTNGAKAENIFWAVAGDIAMGVDAHTEGIFLAYTMIAMKAGNSLNEAAYAQTTVACSGNKAAKLCPMTCGTCSKPTNQNDSSPTKAPNHRPSLPPNDDTDKNDDEVSEEPEC